MPIGQNTGGQLNVYLFEVGMRTLLPALEPGGEPHALHTTVGIHPLLVAPTSVSYSDTSASPITQTVGGTINTRSGRALRRVSLQGTHGVATRGLGPYIGTGPVRAKRFHDEVVRLGEALGAEDVDAAINDLTGTPFIRQLLRGYDPERCTFYVNFYDFHADQHFSVVVRSYNPGIAFGRGAATGLISYSMTLDEAGPIVAGSLATGAVEILFDALGAWQDANGALASYTPGAVIDGALAPLGIAVSELGATIRALDAQADSAQALLAGIPPTETSTAALATYLSVASTVQDEAEGAARTTEAIAPSEMGSDGARVVWEAQPEEGVSEALELADAIADLEDVAEAATWQAAAGALYGQSRETFAAYVTSNGETDVPADVSGTTAYTVGPGDTEATLEEQFGISFDRILALNDLLPDEALLEGTELRIPALRARGSQQIAGLPVLGSHQGIAALGQGLRTDLAVGDDGQLLTLAGLDFLGQGIDWLAQTFESELQSVIAQVPDVVRERMLQIRLGRLYRQDRRIASVDSIDVALSPGALDVAVTLGAINGGTVRTARPQ